MDVQMVRLNNAIRAARGLHVLPDTVVCFEASRSKKLGERLYRMRYIELDAYFVLLEILELLRKESGIPEDILMEIEVLARTEKTSQQAPLPAA